LKERGIKGVRLINNLVRVELDFLNLLL